MGSYVCAGDNPVTNENLIQSVLESPLYPREAPTDEFPTAALPSRGQSAQGSESQATELRSSHGITASSSRSRWMARNGKGDGRRYPALLGQDIGEGSIGTSAPTVSTSSIHVDFEGMGRIRTTASRRGKGRKGRPEGRHAGTRQRRGVLTTCQGAVTRVSEVPSLEYSIPAD